MGILCLNIKILKLCFLWPNETTRLYQRILTVISYLSMVLVAYLQNLGAIVYQITVNLEDLNAVGDNVVASFNFFGFFSIYIFFQLNVRKIQKLASDFPKFVKFCTPEVIQTAEEEITMLTKLLLVYFSIGFMLNFVVPVVDFEKCDQRRLSDYYRAHDPCGLPVRIWWPFDARKPAQYYLLAVINANASVHCGSVVLIVTLTLVGFIIHLNAQMKHLKHRLMNIFGDDVEESTIGILKVGEEEEIQLCVQYHNDIISHADEIFRSFGALIMVHALLTPSVFGVLGYQIFSAVYFTDKLRYTLHLGGWIAMLFLVCYYGQLIMDESVSIGDAAFQSRWYNGHPRLRKYLCLIIMRCQRPLKLEAASINVLSLATFVSIIKTAYSCFTLLITISE